MKFSIVATAFLAQGIAAMPWSFVKGANSNGDEVTHTYTTLILRRIFYLLAREAQLPERLDK
ncbi:hypothetical protein HYE67_010085 [Fusarium culmorum]|uniref:Uncharacterized protein n=1 Tax=Fusarium culmorum TaxID=5516 RepID=A0A2T4H8T5_FUSCU|nr:hypothetical protein FCULG_00005040 [Fusarium culmorum]QPC67854.1 hypothetical protein HYE67_010085 [Fusarium culmorum]